MLISGGLTAACPAYLAAMHSTPACVRKLSRQKGNVTFGLLFTETPNIHNPLLYYSKYVAFSLKSVVF